MRDQFDRKSIRKLAQILKDLVLMWVCLAMVIPGCSQEQKETETTKTAIQSSPTFDGTIVAVGDSLTAGLGVDENQSYPAQLARRLMDDGHLYQVINAGVSGETSTGTLSRIQWVLSTLKPDIVILETGANDGLRGLNPDLLQTNLDQLISILKANNTQVILAGMLMLPNLGPEYTRAFATIYPQVAQKHQVVLIPFFLQGVAGQAQLNQPDKLHPNSQGYGRIVETVYPFVVEAIEKHRTGLQ